MSPVKTGIMQVLAQTLEAVTGVGSVHRQDIPFDTSLLTAADYPAVFFWEEEKKSEYNRLTKGIMDLWIQVFFPLTADDPDSFPEFQEDAEELAAQISDVLAAPAALRAVGVIKISREAVYKAKYNSDFGIVKMNYQLTYGHAAGDASDINP